MQNISQKETVEILTNKSLNQGEDRITDLEEEAEGPTGTTEQVRRGNSKMPPVLVRVL